MSYKNIDNLNDKQNSKEIIKDIITRKEYYSLKTDNKKIIFVIISYIYIWKK